MSRVIQETITNPKKSKVVFSYEGKLLLFSIICVAFLALYLEHELLFFLCCLGTATQLTLKVCLPNPKISFHLKSYCPAFFQAEGRSTHHLELSANFHGSALPYLLISAKHQQNKGQVIRSNHNKFSQFLSGHTYDIFIMVEPLTQGVIEFKGIQIKSLATLGLYEWEHFISLPMTRPVHPRQISLKPLHYLKHFWGESELHELALNTPQQGEYIGWPRTYEPGDPLASINWKRLAQNSFEPIVHNAISSESQEIILILDTALNLRKRGSQFKLHQVCEFARSLALQLEKEGANIRGLVCSKSTQSFYLNSKYNWIEYLNSLAITKVTKLSTAQYELEKLILQKNIKIIHLSLDPTPTLSVQADTQRAQINKLTFSQILSYSLETVSETEEVF